MIKKSKIKKFALVQLFRWMCHAASSRLPVSEVKYSRKKYRGSNSGPTGVYALSCLYVQCQITIQIQNQHREDQ
jgi:hypothetical protein